MNTLTAFTLAVVITGALYCICEYLKGDDDNFF